MPEGIKGIGIYHGNIVSSFHNVAALGIEFVFVKATQGTTEIDPCHADYIARVRESGMLAGSYHFFTADDPLLQAEHFVSNADIRPGDLFPALDVETYFEGVGASAAICAARIKEMCGHYPIVYASDSFFQSYLKDALPAETTLWIARYGATPVTPYTFWQFSEQGQLAGISGNVDLDVLNGDVSSGDAGGWKL